MRIELTPPEARIIGCLIEKEIVTPAQYPLSFSALTTACNQKSSREPVMNLGEAEVQRIVEGLIKKHLVSDRGGFGSRVTKYQHRFANVGFGSLEFTAQELGILCVLLLRGPQTAGELRARTNRLCEFTDAGETDRVLQGLAVRSDGPFVVRLARDAGRREPRFAHLFGDLDAEPAADDPEQAEPLATGTPAAGRLEQLEERVLALQEEVDEIRARVARLEGTSDDWDSG